MPGPTIILDEVTPLLANVRTEAQARGLALVGARAVGSLVKEHLYGLDAQRHQFGRHYYRGAGDSVHSALTPQGAAVSISQVGIRQRLLGGPIVPRFRKFLTIPATPEAYGMRAREFHDLEFKFALNSKTGALQPALVRIVRAQYALRKKRTKKGTILVQTVTKGTIGGEVVYWLVRKVVQRADPSVLPYNEHMSARATSAIKDRLLRLRQRSSPSPSANTKLTDRRDENL